MFNIVSCVFFLFTALYVYPVNFASNYPSVRKSCRDTMKPFIKCSNFGLWSWLIAKKMVLCCNSFSQIAQSSPNCNIMSTLEMMSPNLFVSIEWKVNVLKLAYQSVQTEDSTLWIYMSGLYLCLQKYCTYVCNFGSVLASLQKCDKSLFSQLFS